jgi:hypothetical protein
VNGSPGNEFGPPDGHPNGKKITLTDKNDNDSTASGPWIYKLCAMVGTTLYTTTASVSSQGTTTDPSIKNL